MNLRNDCPSAGEAWEKFLEFSPGSREVLAANEILAAGGRNPEALLEVRSAGKYRIEWTELSARADAPSRRLAALREWQRAELVRLAFLDFATLPPAGNLPPDTRPWRSLWSARPWPWRGKRHLTPIRVGWGDFPSWPWANWGRPT